MEPIRTIARRSKLILMCIFIKYIVAFRNILVLHSDRVNSRKREKRDGKIGERGNEMKMNTEVKIIYIYILGCYENVKLKYFLL